MTEEPDESSSPSNSKHQPISCEECKINPWKYKCPGCSLRSCSLICVNSHKKRTACTGKRPLTSFVPISQFDDNLLISDYNLLEDVKRVADSAQRMRVKLCGNNVHARVPYYLKTLRNAAASRRTKMLFLPNGMLKRQKNRTHYDNRNKLISWTIEWRFHSTDVVLVDHRVNENTTLSSVIENHLKPGPWHHPLSQFCENLGALRFFIRKYTQGPKSPFRQLNIKAPIRDQLANLYILEYPVIHVYLPTHTCDFDVINDLSLVIKMPAHRDDPSSTKGVTFMEEEIEDKGSSVPRVSDLMDHAPDKKGTKNTQKDSMWVPPLAKRPKSDSCCDTRVKTIEDDKDIGGKSCVEQLDEVGDLDFDFETGSTDEFPDIGDANHDEFFDFDGILVDKRDLEAGEIVREEEIEEGEIV